MTAPATPSFWEFSLALYGKPGVAPALIGLQDRLGLDVNMLLYCCWAGTRGRALSADDLAQVEALAEPWQAEAVRPLRTLRRRLKGGFEGLPSDRVEAFRRRLNELEIEGEHIAQDAMAERLGGERKESVAAPRVTANLRAYLQLRTVRIDASDRESLTVVLRACCPDAEREGLSFA
jgi:uncharacterized protein (TIGR02444 family)